MDWLESSPNNNINKLDEIVWWISGDVEGPYPTTQQTSVEWWQMFRPPKLEKSSWRPRRHPPQKKQKNNELKEISHLENMLDCKLNDLRICSSTAPFSARIFPQNQGLLVSTNNSWVRTLEVGLIDVDMDMVD